MSPTPLVLIVEDDESSREMYSELLGSAGYAVLVARNGDEALRAARRHRPRVVVTDVSMPGMDGWALSRALRKDRATSRVGIIAVTGHARDIEVERRAREEGIDVLLVKPCSPDELLGEIRKLLAPGCLPPVSARRRLARFGGLRHRSNQAPKRSEKQRPKSR